MDGDSVALFSKGQSRDKTGYKLLGFTLVVAGCGWAWGGGSSPSPTDVPSFSILSSATPGSVVIGSGALTQDEAKNLYIKFIDAQKAELRALQHKQASDRRELDAAQASRRKAWLKNEQETRHQFFAQHPKGSDRRTYVKDYLERLKALDRSLKDEHNQRLHTQDQEVQALKQDQVIKLREFQDALKRGDRPADRLWPAPGR